MKILIVDNHDSFTHNLEHLVATYTNTEPWILPYSQWNPNDIEPNLDLIIISAGPGHPRDYPRYAQLFAKTQTPLLGICLGMQIINVNLGGTVIKLASCVHGQADTLLFQRKSFRIARYHSLYVDKVGQGLEIIARNAQNIPMALRHQQRPILGYQFHPESFLTDDGNLFLAYALDTLLPSYKKTSLTSDRCFATAASY